MEHIHTRPGSHSKDATAKIARIELILISRDVDYTISHLVKRVI
jgi:hypothetical protein